MRRIRIQTADKSNAGQVRLRRVTAVARRTLLTGYPVLPEKVPPRQRRFPEPFPAALRGTQIRYPL